MAFVYIVMENYPHEGDEVVGVYSSMISAEIRKKEEEKEDDSGGYNEFSIIRHEVN